MDVLQGTLFRETSGSIIQNEVLRKGVLGRTTLHQSRSGHNLAVEGRNSRQPDATEMPSMLRVWARGSTARNRGAVTAVVKIASPHSIAKA